MSRIDDLIRDLCPSGVPYVALDRLFETRNGYTPSTSDGSLWVDGTIPWFRMEDIRANGRVLSDSIQHISPRGVKGGRLFPANSILVATSATVGEHALITVPHLSNQRFTSLALRPGFSESLDMRFIHYYCFVLDEWCRNNTTVSSFASVDMPRFRAFRFPVPPLELQREIVRILDHFTELEAELEAELTARRLQYSFHRERLFRFAEGEARRLALGEFAVLQRGSGMPKSDFTAEGIPAIHYGQIYTHFGGWATKVKSYVAASTAARLTKVDPGDVVVANTSENVNDVGKAVAWLGETQAVTGGHATVVKHGENPKYLAYYFQTDEFNAAKRKHAMGTKVVELSSKSLAKIEIPLPPRAAQDRIAETLDKFDALVNDISIGLPAELAARRRQYEYYRDKLLTFPEAVA